ncbi:hypothetical protein [Thiovibrio frasassiensis]|uniref:Uncharacterized protein n=1 Tax=Thiovibrio frasassiensis TaxID=2984131 RepID=A0A9X4MGE1_9BACT|nr:hypothetical protein [Thiovibrio frasassiensis]MDG4475405.1 hypothetical protein [Thiovibrio frasassiensis]
MSFHKYAGACTELSKELLKSLTPEDVDELRTELASLGRREFASWYFRHTEEVKKYVQATPSQRIRRKAWQDSKFRLLLTGSALVYLRAAQSVLSNAATCEDLISHGVGYRDLASQTGDQFRALMSEGFHWWPLPGDSPFGD